MQLKLNLVSLAIAGFMALGAATTAQATSLAEVLMSASEHGRQQSFVKDDWKGKMSRFEFDANNLRHANAYAVLKRGFEIATGESFADDAKFKRLLASRQVRTTECVGDIWTTGVDRNGNIFWFSRACHVGEEIVQVRVNGYWVTVASDWCWNLVNGSLVIKAPAPITMDSDHFKPETPVVNPPVVEPPVVEPPVVEPPKCTEKCEPTPETPKKQNPGNGKPVGNSPYDGITGNSHKNDASSGSPKADTMDGQRGDQGSQPGGGQGPSDSNGNGGGNGRGNGGGNGKNK